MANFIEKTLRRSELVNGRQSTAQELATEFAKLSPKDRVDALEAIDGDVSGSHFDGIEGMRAAARFQRHRRALTDMHQRLNRIGK